MSVRDSAPPAPTSFPATIARAGLGAVEEDGGSSTVTFPAPGAGIPEQAPASPAPYTVSRSFLDDARAAATDYAQDAASDAGAGVRERARSAADAATTAVTSARSSGAGEADKQFEELYDRLKRELLIEQEQLGQLFHEP
jgi:hypothetical protein